MISRRNVLALAGGLCATASGGRLFAAEPDEEEVTDKLAQEILYEESEPGKQAKAIITPYWFQQPSGTRPSPNWPTDNVSFDYAHLVAQPSSDEPFELTPQILETLFALNSFNRTAELPKVLFGLRGCSLTEGDQTGFGPGHMVRATRPNHLDPKCLIGVWDTTAGAVALFKASTVPNVDLMEKQIEGTLGCNLLPTGYHHYKCRTAPRPASAWGFSSADPAVGAPDQKDPDIRGQRSKQHLG